jgi:DNA-binding NarL/FixJ family response regulator
MTVSKEPGAVRIWRPVRVWRSGEKWWATVNGIVLPKEFDTEGAVRAAVRIELARIKSLELPVPRQHRQHVVYERPYKLDPEQRTLAVSLVQEGQPVSEVARTFNVHPSTIYRYLRAAQASDT